MKNTEKLAFTPVDMKFIRIKVQQALASFWKHCSEEPALSSSNEWKMWSFSSQTRLLFRLVAIQERSL